MSHFSDYGVNQELSESIAASKIRNPFSFSFALARWVKTCSNRVSFRF
jgi:hypothetical protein